MAQAASSGTSLLYGTGHLRAAGFPPKHSCSRLSAWPLSINVLSSRVLAHLGFAAGQHSTAQHTPFWYLCISLALPKIPQLTQLRSCNHICSGWGHSRRHPTAVSSAPGALLGKVFGLFSGYVMAHGSLILAISPQPFTPCEWRWFILCSMLPTGCV